MAGLSVSQTVLVSDRGTQGQIQTTIESLTILSNIILAPGRRQAPLQGLHTLLASARLDLTAFFGAGAVRLATSRVSLHKAAAAFVQTSCP